MRILKGHRTRFLGAALIIPLAWTAVEFFRAEVALTGYAWGALAYPLIAKPWLSSPASAFGVYFVSFLACVPAGVLAEELLGARGARRRSIATLALACLAFLVGALGTPDIRPSGTINVGVVQTNLPQDNKLSWSLDQAMNDMDRFLVLTRAAAASEPRPDVIVWPETMVPGGTLSPDAIESLRREQIVRRFDVDGQEHSLPAIWFAEQLLDTQQALGVPMLVGAEGTDGFKVERTPNGGIRLTWDRRFNSVFEINHGAIQPTRYDKGRLTPFGEFFPYIRHWPWLQHVMLDAGARGMSFNLSEGTSREVFEIPAHASPSPVRVVTPICFEVTSSAYMRALVYEHGERRADVIVTPTNDGWFGVSKEGRDHHLLMARWRCVELNIPMVRAANTGVSAFIDASGRILARGVDSDPSGHNVEGVLVESLRFDAKAQGSLFGRVGNVFGWGCVLITFLMVLGSMWSGKRPLAESTP
jgi:apolipoprotein N-acyltransferase